MIDRAIAAPVRPPLTRWLLALFVTAVLAPLASPGYLLMQIGVAVEADGLFDLAEMTFYMLAFTYVIGGLFALAGATLGALMVAIWFGPFVRMPWWGWALAGLATGTAVLAALFLMPPDPDGPGEALGIAVALAGLPGLAGALIFRRVLLGRRPNDRQAA